MTPEQQRIEIAKECGWKEAMQRHTSFGHVCVSGISPKHPIGNTGIKKYLPVPDYLNDLNAVHEAEETLDYDSHMKFRGILSRAVLFNERKYISATAPQRSEAFLRTIGKWIE